MIDGSEKRNCELAFELHHSHVCEKRSNPVSRKNPIHPLLLNSPRKMYGYFDSPCKMYGLF